MEPFEIPTPHVDPPSPEVIEKMKSITTHDRKLLTKTDYYKQLAKPIKDRRKQRKKLQRQEWFWNKGLPILNLLLALIAAITGIIALLVR